MRDQQASLISRLLEAGNPRELENWEGQSGYYVASCRASTDDVLGLINIACKWADSEWPSDADLPDTDADREHAELLPVAAWRTLAELKAEGAVTPLVAMLRSLEDSDDDWVSEELPIVFGKIGEPSIPALTDLAKDADQPGFVRSTAAWGLRRVADYHAEARSRIVACLAELLENAATDDVEFATTVLVHLVELKAVEAAEAMERAFASNRLDVGMLGNWEDVRRRLGVEGLGLKMPEQPYNSIERLRSQLGIGSFSDEPIFDWGEIDLDAEQAYYQRAWDTFSTSSEAQRVIAEHGNLGWFRMLLEFGINYLGESVDQMTLGSVREFVLDHVPRKVSTKAERASSIVCELTAFWEYLDRVYKHPEAKSIVEWLQTDGLTAELEAELSDPSNFGMAKAMVMSGIKAGYDMTSEAGIAAFTAAHNRSLQSRAEQSRAEPRVVSPVIGKPRVGRNDPCPCGSGKKFKKCCL